MSTENQDSQTTTKTSATSRRTFIAKSTLVGSGLLLASTLGRSTESPATADTAPKSDDATNDTLRTIHGLRSTHGNFTDQEIPEETLQAIIGASVRAANASNMQNYSIVVVRDRDVMKRVCGYRGSRLLLYFADHNRAMTSARSLGYEYAPDTIVGLVTSTIDASLAAQTAAIAARSLGVDYLLTNGLHRGNIDRLWTLLDLPPTHCFPVIALVLGYPTAEPEFLKGRLQGPGVVHEGKYHQLTPEEAEELTRQYDDKPRHLGLHEHWDTDGHKHYLDWMFAEWIGRNNRPSNEPTQMFEVIKRCGYLDG